MAVVFCIIGSYEHLGSPLGGQGLQPPPGDVPELARKVADVVDRVLAFDVCCVVMWLLCRYYCLLATIIIQMIMCISCIV